MLFFLWKVREGPARFSASECWLAPLQSIFCLREVIVVCMTICHANEPSLYNPKQWDNAPSKISLEIKTNLLVSMETMCWHQHKRNQWLEVVDLTRGEEHLGKTYTLGRQHDALQSHSKGRGVIERPPTKCQHVFLPIIYLWRDLSLNDLLWMQKEQRGQKVNGWCGNISQIPVPQFPKHA